MKKAGLFLIILLLLVMIKNILSSMLSSFNRAKILDEMQSALSEKKREQEYLVQKLNIVKTDSFVEEEARRRLGLIKEGEEVIIDEKVKEKLPEKKPEPVPNWKKWLNLFID